MDNLFNNYKHNYLYESRGNVYPQNKGDTIKLKDNYKNYEMLIIELVKEGTFLELFMHTYEIYQNSSMSYQYYIDDFIVKPSIDGTELLIVNDAFSHVRINCIAGYRKRGS